MGDAGVVFLGFLNHTQRVVSTTVEHNHQTKLSWIVPAEVFGVLVQYWANAVLLVVGGDEQQQAGSRGTHGVEVLPKAPSRVQRPNTEDWVKTFGIP